MKGIFKQTEKGSTIRDKENNVHFFPGCKTEQECAARLADKNVTRSSWTTDGGTQMYRYEIQAIVELKGLDAASKIKTREELLSSL